MNCTIEEKSPFETESAISPAISEPMLKYNPFAEIKDLDDLSRDQTDNLLYGTQLLYLLSYRGHVIISTIRMEFLNAD